ncbi:hypothetical protein ACKWTF_006837 [Chironomus riparius]
MKITSVITLIILMNFCTFIVSDNYEAIGIIEEIVTSHGTQDIYYVNLLTSDNYIKDKNSMDFMSDLIKQLSKWKSVIIINEKFLSRLLKKRILLTVILLNSFEEFKKMASKFTHIHFNFAGYYVIFFENAKDQEVHNIFQIVWNLYIRNINLVRYINKSVVVETFFPFTPTHCNKTIPAKLAKYQDGKFLYKADEYFPKKFTNLHKCPIKIASVTALSPSIIKREFPNGTFELFGRDIEILKTLAHELNFYVNNTYLHPWGSWGVMSPNKTMSGSMGMAQRRATDFTLGNLNLKHDRFDIMDFCFAYYLETLIFVIPSGKPYTPFYKLLRPFQDYVWFSVLFVVLSCVIVISILSFLPQKYRDFVYGAKVNAPLLNVVNAIYGGTQTVVPKYNFARSLLMMFQLFSLVLRSLYQGALFQFLQANDNQPEMQNIEEMAASHFKFYMIPSYDDMTRTNVAMKGKRVIIDPISDQTWMKRYMDKTLDYNFLGTVINSISDVLYLNKIKAHQNKPLLTVCKVSFVLYLLEIFLQL